MDETQTVQLPFSKTTWAQYLNVSRTSLSRELRTLCTQGILAMEEKKIRILQPGRMQDLLYLEEQSGSVRTDYAYNLLCDILSVLEVDDMARGVRRSIDDQIAALDTVMEKTQEKLDKLKRERNELLGKKKEEMVREVTDLIQGAGISVEQLRQIIEQEIQKEQTA